MSRIQTEDVKRLAEIARIAITEEEVELYTKQLDEVLAYADMLSEVDTTDVKPTVHVLDMKNVIRENDTPGEGLKSEDILRNAPDYEGSQIRVPSILE